MKRLLPLLPVVMAMFLARSAMAETNTPPLGWAQILDVVTNTPAGGPEQEIALPLLAGKTARIHMEYARDEKASDGREQRLLIHIEPIAGDIIFHCWQPPSQNAPKTSGTIGGTIRKVSFSKQGLRETVYILEMDATSFEPDPGEKASAQ